MVKTIFHEMEILRKSRFSKTEIFRKFAKMQIFRKLKIKLLQPQNVNFTGI